MGVSPSLITLARPVVSEQTACITEECVALAVEAALDSSGVRIEDGVELSSVTVKFTALNLLYCSYFKLCAPTSVAPLRRAAHKSLSQRDECSNLTCVAAVC
jgi:hypothetical protein